MESIATIGVIPNNNAAINSALVAAITDTLFIEHNVLSRTFKKAFPNGVMQLEVDAIELKKWKTQNYASKLLTAESVEIKHLEKKIANHFEYVNIGNYGGFVSAMYLWLKDSQNVKRVFIDFDEYLGLSHQFAFIVDTNFKKYSVSMRWETS